MRVKELRKFLYDRNVQCKGCAEKDDFVKLAIESRALETADQKQKSMEELMSKLRGMPGMEGMKMYGKNDLDDLVKGYDAAHGSRKPAMPERDL